MVHGQALVRTLIFYARAGTIIPHLKELRVNNFIYTMEPDARPKLFEVFPSLARLQYFFSEDSSLDESDIITLTSNDITTLTPSTVTLDPYSH